MRVVAETESGPSPAALLERLRRSTVDRIVRQSGPTDVRAITGKHEGAARPAAVAHGPRPAARLGSYALASGLVGAAGLVAAGLMALLPLADPGMVFLAAVLLTAVLAGLGPSILAAVLGLLVYDFLFVDPRFTLTVAKPQDILSMFMFLVVAVLTSELTARVRDQAEAARRREERTAALYAFAREIAGSADLDDLVRVILDHVARLFGTGAALLLPDAGRLVLRAIRPPGTALADTERATATWVWEHDRPAGRGTNTLPGGEWFHLPLCTVRGAVGVLALRIEAPGAPLPLDQRQLLEALAGQAAVAIERTRVDLVEAVIESIEDGLVVLDPDGVVVDVNEVACAILGFGRAQAVGVRFDDLGTHHPHYLRLREAVREFLAHPEHEHDAVELALFLRGRDHYYVLRPTPFRGRDGSHAGLILVLQDVTYVRDQEARREQLMATLSHELRTPVTSLGMAVELLRRGAAASDDERRGLLDTAHEDVVRLEDVAQRLLDVSRWRATSIALERENVDLGEVITRVARLFALQARERGVALETPAPAGGVTIAGDATKITWALSNLIANALRYTPGGGRIRIEATPEDGAVRVAVSDTGPGIPPDQRERIFERFVQGVDGADAGAAGLGLAIVRDIVQAHGGRIHLESEVGKGSRFTLELPRS